MDRRVGGFFGRVGGLAGTGWVGIPHAVDIEVFRWMTDRRRTSVRQARVELGENGWGFGRFA